MFPQIPFLRVNWLVSSFLIGTLFLSVTAVPLYLWFFGIDWFQIALFFAMLAACGFSITLGYHRLFSHLTFQAHWIVRFFTVIFGAGAFENSVLLWSFEHRSHHKHVDHDDDPYCITKGLFYAHMGWLMFKLKPLPAFDNVADLKKDPLLVWQDRYDIGKSPISDCPTSGSDMSGSPQSRITPSFRKRTIPLGAFTRPQ
jgi:stearoyl-CoA desaturase (Delta-9 desaturase)